MMLALFLVGAAFGVYYAIRRRRAEEIVAMLDRMNRLVGQDSNPRRSP